MIDNVIEVDGHGGVEDLLTHGHVGNIGCAGHSRYSAAFSVDGSDHATLHRPEQVAGVFRSGI